MADFGSPVAYPERGAGLKTLSNLLSISQQRQTLQTGAAIQQQEQIEAQKKQVAYNEQQAMGQLNPETYTKNGVLDAGAYARDVIKAAPQSGLGFERAAKAYEVQHAQIGVQTAAQNLNEEQRKDASAALAATIADPKFSYGDLVSAADQYKAQNPHAAGVMDTMLTHLSPDDPLPMTANKVKGLSRAMLGAGELAGAGGLTTPQTIATDTGGAIQFGTKNAATGEVNPVSGPAMEKTLPPGVSVLTDAKGAQFWYDTKHNRVVPAGEGGAGVGARPSGSAGTPKPAGNEFFQPSYPGQNKDIETNQQEVAQVREQAGQAPLTRNINSQILRLSRDAKTGPGTEAWQHVLGAVGAPLGLSPTASYQEVGKFLEKNAINNMQAMGAPGSDARLSAAAAANGSTHFSPEALQAVTKFNDATNTALIKYRQGIDQAVGTRKPDYTALADFKAAWTKNFDVDVFRVEDAIRNKDEAELSKIKKELGAERMKELATKRRNLESLSATGELPK